jgi:hypothetical protein
MKNWSAITQITEILEISVFENIIGLKKNHQPKEIVIKKLCLMSSSSEEVSTRKKKKRKNRIQKETKNWNLIQYKSFPSCLHLMIVLTT